MADATYVAEITVWDPAAGGGSGAAVTKYYATDGFATIGTDTPADTHVDERLKQPLQINRTMFAPNATRGRSSVGYGDIVLVNGDGELDAFTTYGVDGRTVKVYRGTIGDAYPGSWTKIFEGTMQGVEVTQEYVSLKIRDELARLNVPLQTTKYTGGGLGTLEGTEDTLKGKPKPVCYGVVKNVAPPCVETAKLIYQVADGTVSTVDKVYDRGVELKPMMTSMFLTGGASGNLQSSPDGTTHTSRTSQFSTSEVRGAAHGNGVWVIVGGATGGSPDSKISYSTDGITYTAAASPFGTSEILAVAFGAGRFIAGSGSGRLASSEDGETWTLLNATPFGAGSVGGIFYLDATWFVTSFTQSLAYSPDGINWTTVTTTGFQPESITAGLGLFVACGLDTSATDPAIRTSPDGHTWTARTAPASHTASSGQYWGATFGASLFVIVGATTAAIIATSSDGITWTAQSPDGAPLTGTLRAAGFDGTSFLVVGDNGASTPIMQTSTNGTAWTSRTSAVSARLNFAVHAYGLTAVTYASSADLLDNSLAPQAGYFKPYLSASGSYFRLGATPDGLVTADVTQGAAASNRTTAQIWATILDTRAGMASGDWNATDVTDLDSANNDVIGFWTDQEGRVADVIDAVKDSAGAASYIDAGGVFRIKQFVAPSGAAALSVTANDLIRPLSRKLPAEQGQGIPQYRTILKYQRNYSPQITDVAASVTDARKAFLAKEWREIADTDTAVQTKHLLAIESVEETLLDVAADATTEADRRQTLRGTARQMFELWLQLNDDTADLELNDVIDVTHSRYGLSGGESMRVIGLSTNVEKRELQVTAWL